MSETGGEMEIEMVSAHETQTEVATTGIQQDNAATSPTAQQPTDVEIAMPETEVEGAPSGLQSQERGQEDASHTKEQTDLEVSTKWTEPEAEAIALKEEEDQSPPHGVKAMMQRFSISFAAVLLSFVGEFLGTFILVTGVCTGVTLAVILNQLAGAWQAGILMGSGLGLAIYVSAHISDAHLNPAVTLAFAIVRFRVFSWKKIAVYIIAQLCGAFVAGAIMFGLYRGTVEAFEDSVNIDRGMNGSERSAMILCDYFPNPAIFPDDESLVSMAEALFIEAWGTGILVFVIFALTDPRNSTVGSGNNKVAVPILIGLTLAFLITLYVPLTQASFNPARDFGPRLFAAMAGWGKIAIPGPRDGFWLYILGPLIGGPIGGALHDFGVGKVLRLKEHLKPSNSK